MLNVHAHVRHILKLPFTDKESLDYCNPTERPDAVIRPRTVTYKTVRLNSLSSLQSTRKHVSLVVLTAWTAGLGEGSEKPPFLLLKSTIWRLPNLHCRTLRKAHARFSSCDVDSSASGSLTYRIIPPYIACSSIIGQEHLTRLVLTSPPLKFNLSHNLPPEHPSIWLSKLFHSGPDFQTPFIFDESYDFSDPSIARYDVDLKEEILASSDFEVVLLSMSGYDKAQQPSFGDYNATRAFQQPYAATYAQPSYQQNLTPYGTNAESAAYTASAPFASQPALQYSPSPGSLPRVPQVPEIVSFSPTTGHAGETITVYLRSPFDLLAIPSATCVLMFGARQCDGFPEALEPRDSYYQYALTTEVPFHSTTGFSSPQVPLRLMSTGDPNQPSHPVEVGTFTYDISQLKTEPSPSPQIANRKRKLSVETDEPMHAPAKRLLSKQQIQTQNTNEVGTRSYGPHIPTTYTYPQGITPSVSGEYGAMSKVPNPSAYTPQPNHSHLLYQQGARVGVNQGMIKVPSPQTPSYSPSFSTVNKATYSPGSMRGSTVARATAGTSVNIANPPLIRTSTLQSSPSPAGTPAGGVAGSTFNPYAMYPHKAVLKISGELNSMVDNWATEEWNAKRRLVQFTRRQSGSVIHTDFTPVDPENRQPNSICISCIWWEEKRECFITSVDTIYLLESLVAVRFTVEEKNRIRRNLEGFRPLTVSKAKQESEEFFKIIMSFPNPKPRNIEKDVKVFPWRVLAIALKKIIGKYVSVQTFAFDNMLMGFQSASYSSTAGALLTPASSTYGSGDQSASSSDLHPAASPGSVNSSTGISPHMQTMPMHRSPCLPLSNLSDARVAASTLMPPYQSTSTSYNYQPLLPSLMTQQQSPQPQQSQAQQMGLQSQGAISARQSWDFNAYVNTTPTTGNAGNDLTLDLLRGPSQRGSISAVANHEFGSLSPYHQMTHPSSGP
ncbi:MAG: hypothetical protein M1834_008660 [Cirrosporium novae-zelandiae]|nr:MAG: hypothetical protein M1834_008660 [Cirrosporium novae-zelandiae]